MLSVPLFTNTSTANFYKETIYLVAAVVFWIWLYRDASGRGIKASHQLLVGAGWLVAAFLVVPIYLISTRGWHQGGLATLVFVGLVLGLFAALGMGMFLSVEVANAIRL